MLEVKVEKLPSKILWGVKIDSMEENIALFSAMQLGLAFKLNFKLSRFVVFIWDWGVKW